MDLDRFFTRLTKEPQIHACWLNSLSYLEYRGFRKIARALGTKDMNEAILLHARDEVQHAYHLKKMALKVGGNDFQSYSSDNLLAEDGIKKYFYELDKAIAEYGSVTTAIEERAMLIYEKYESFLEKIDGSISLKAIIKDEQKHLAFHSLATGKNKFTAIEEALFQVLWRDFETDLERRLLEKNQSLSPTL